MRQLTAERVTKPATYCSHQDARGIRQIQAENQFKTGAHQPSTYKY